MFTERKKVIETCDFLKPYVSAPPQIGLITGTGLSDILDGMIIDHHIDYTDIPHFPVSTVESHNGSLLIGRFEEKRIMVLQGRFHLYEGYTPTQVTYPVRVMQELSVKTLILSNAAGGINLEFNAGDIMVITDHINLTGQNPLTGPNEGVWGIRFPDMIQVYDPHLVRLVQTIAQDGALPVRYGIYAGLTGPSLETPAETRYLKTIGADAVGFSTIMEAIAGVHAQMRMIGLSMITNINDPDAPVPTTLEAVVETAQKAVGPMNQLLRQLIRKIEP